MEPTLQNDIVFGGSVKEIISKQTYPIVGYFQTELDNTHVYALFITSLGYSVLSNLDSKTGRAINSLRLNGEMQYIRPHAFDIGKSGKINKDEKLLGGCISNNPSAVNAPSLLGLFVFDVVNSNILSSYFIKADDRQYQYIYNFTDDNIIVEQLFLLESVYQFATVASMSTYQYVEIIRIQLLKLSFNQIKIKQLF
ncbi:UNKNOWN [Stylonychia lemnae]|uniref:Uncharacterized protein n=1 Tax=Stylonychia lemnae TaxID=5949 RepID=A0A077ZVI3_STYLE|nr:UNKNOWN [Stylonychia lemnae]|eukprot:CDW73634.1 UNKNOWN [Stylonychia lemnae]